MEFQLPQNLQVQLLPYDPTLKKLAKSEKSSTSRKSKYPIGNVNDLIPDHIVAPHQLQAAVDTINTSEAPHRHHLFKRFEKLGEDPKVFAILYHYQGLWVAAWLPRKEDNYLYGYSIAHKDTDKLNHDHSYMYGQLPDLGDTYTPVKYGRSSYRVTSQLVTIEMIDKSSTAGKMWRPVTIRAYGTRSQHIYQAINQFEDQLFSGIPQWEDDYRHSWSRLSAKKNSLQDIIFESRLVFIKDGLKLEDNQTCEFTPETILEHCSIFSGLDLNDEAKAILNKPFFKKWTQEQFDRIIDRFNDPLTDTKTAIRAPYRQIGQIYSWINKILCIWPDTPIDYFQSNIKTFLTIDCSLRTTDRVRDWVREHMPVSSMFQILSKFTEEAHERYTTFHRSYEYSTRDESVRVNFSDLRDTFELIDTVLRAGNELKPPKRWRITEFHDHVQAEAWKVTHENITLPQDLFPSPIKVTLNDTRWTFFQPHDLHQLSSWGQAVRNCVGSAANYADGVKKKQHFIVLAMLDNQPRFTIQLKVDMGRMSVTQIAGLHNSRLSSEETESYTKAFGVALRQREEELVTH